jgi:TrmH family RNA methyltransferase
MPSRAQRKLWRSLRRRKGRDASGLFLAEGRRLLAELLASDVQVEGVAAIARIPRTEWAWVGGQQMLLLDGIQDPGNVGTLIRTGEALGVRVVVCLPGTADPWGPKVVRAAAGSGFRLPVFESSRDEALARLRALDAELWVADAGGVPLLRGAGRPARLALALGSEAHGVSDTLRGQAHRILSIGMEAPVDSLNVAVAGAILIDRIFGRSDGGRGKGGG